MKIKGQDFDRLAERVRQFDTPESRARYLARDFPRSDVVKDLNKRYRYDLFYAARGYDGMPDAYTDAHYYSALKKIVPDLEED